MSTGPAPEHFDAATFNVGLVDLLGQFIPTEPIAIPTGAPEHFDAALVDFLGQYILNLNDVIRRQQARIDALEARP
jgi:hypothetical protein